MLTLTDAYDEPNERPDTTLVVGRRLKNGKQLTYDTSLFGDWVRYLREDVRGWTLQDAADHFNENVLETGVKQGVPLTGPAWRRQYELLGKTTQATPGAHRRNGKVDRHHCRAIALTLGLEPAEVLNRAGFVADVDTDSVQDVTVQAHLLKTGGGSEYAELLAYARDLRDRQLRRHARKEDEEAG